MKSIKVVSFALAVLFITLAVCLCSCSSSNTMDGNYKVTYVKNLKMLHLRTLKNTKKGTNFRIWK